MQLEEVAGVHALWTQKVLKLEYHPDNFCGTILKGVNGGFLKSSFHNTSMVFIP